MWIFTILRKPISLQLRNSMDIFGQLFPKSLPLISFDTIMFTYLHGYEQMNA